MTKMKRRSDGATRRRSDEDRNIRRASDSKTRDKRVADGAGNAGGLMLRWIPAGSLKENPANWRRHPPEQMDAIREAINDPEIGWAGVLLFNERTGRLIDGHARREAVAADTLVPVICGRWSEAGERKILATLDPLAGMAMPDSDALTRLLEQVEFDTPGLRKITDDLSRWLSEHPSESEPVETGEDREQAPPPPRFAVLVECRDEAQQAELLKKLGKQGYKCRAMAG